MVLLGTKHVQGMIDTCTQRRGLDHHNCFVTGHALDSEYSGGGVVVGDGHPNAGDMHLSQWCASTTSRSSK